MGIAVLFGIVAFLLVIGGGRMSETGKTAGERKAGLFCVAVGSCFAVGAILLAVMALAPDLRTH